MEYVKVMRKDGTEEAVPVYQWDELPLEEIEAPVLISAFGQGHEKIGYLTEFAAFDIESTTMPGKKAKKVIKHKDGTREIREYWVKEPSAFMWHWQFCFAGYCVFGRRWEEFFNLLDRIVSYYNLKKLKRLVIYIFNMGFEFQFMYPFLFRRYGEELRIFSTAPHAPVKITCPDGLEFRCAWKLTNMSLYMFLHTEAGCPYEKAWGDLDYRKIRTADTPITETEKGYNLLDVLGLWSALKAKMRADRDTIVSVPLTSTGYPRRDARKECRADKDYREKVFLKNLLTAKVYELLQELKRGGDTHADRMQAYRILLGMWSYDYVSEYPAALLLYDYPSSSFSPYGRPESREEFESLMGSGKACIARIVINKPKVKDNEPMPYIPIDKITHRQGKVKADNGRLLESEGFICLTINEIDWEIIKGCYDWAEHGLICTELWTAPKAPLPDPLRRVIMRYFAQKCELKEQIKATEKLLEKTPESEELVTLLNDLNYRYGKVKNKLNGIFGMMYTDPVHEEVLMDEDGKWTEELPKGKTVEDMLDKHNKSRNSFLTFAWGPWVTAYGRRMLRELQACAVDKESGRKLCAYSDTDSAKARIWDEDALAALVEKQKALARERGAVYVSKSGKEYLMGYPEKDAYMRRFVTMGAKKYAYEDDKGLLHVTVSGVANVHAPGDKLGAGARELLEHGGLEAFKVGFKFRKAGGSTIWYGHEPIHEIRVQGSTMETASYAAITDSEYTLGLEKEYQKLLGVL